jgi:diguanylate cyclase
VAESPRTFSKSELARALDRQEMKVLFQPQMTADGKSVACAEALVRWDHPEKGKIGPVDFVAEAERCGLIDTLGLYVLEHACHAARAWRIPIAVNISPTHFARASFVADVERVLAMLWFPPSRLEIEIVESAAFDDPARARSQIDALHKLGARVSMDDFGTGYSSLSLLQNLSFDKVKIDKSFVAAIPATRSVAILHAMIALVRALGMKVTAEGVETVEQQRFLKAAGCHYLQGYLFSRPVPAAEITALLDRTPPAPRSNSPP